MYLGRSKTRSVSLCGVPAAILTGQPLEVIVRVVGFVAIDPGTDHDELRIIPGAVDQVMRILDTSLETDAHPGRKRRFTVVGNQRELTLEYIDELIGPRVPVAQGRFASGLDGFKIHSELRECEAIAETSSFPGAQSAGERLGWGGSGCGGYVDLQTIGYQAPYTIPNRSFSRSKIPLMTAPSDGSSSRDSGFHWLRVVSKKSPP